jgi:hypothetical protein
MRKMMQKNIPASIRASMAAGIFTAPDVVRWPTIENGSG